MNSKYFEYLLFSNADIAKSTSDRHGEVKLGNRISTVINEKILHSYSVIGLHKAYNNESSLQFLDQNECKYSFYGDISSGKISFDDQLNEFILHLKTKELVGIEMDIDAIEYAPSSAFTPSGISAECARKYISQCSQNISPIYLHLPEAAPKTNEKKMITGKLLSYLTYDFIHNHPKRLKK
jgi:formiminoglutamase